MDNSGTTRLDPHQKGQNVMAGRTPVQEQIEDALRQVRSETQSQVSSGDYGGEPVYIENLQNGRSIFTHKTLGAIRWEPAGYEESIQAVSPALLRDSAFRRRLNARDPKVRIVPADEVDAKLDGLKAMPTPEDTDMDRIHKALAEGASEKTSRYAVDNLQEHGFERGQITPEQALGRPNQVQRSGTSVTTKMPNSTVETTVTDVRAPESVLTEPVREGELRPDTGQ